MSEKMFYKILSCVPEDTLRRKFLVNISIYTPYIVGIIYVLTGMFLLITKNDLLLKFILIPATVLVVASILRYLTKRKRPFEKYGFEPVIQQHNGRSFPSNHTASAFVIALACIKVNLVLGIIMLLIACVIAMSRLFTCVHYPTDILGGALIGIIGGIIGFVII